ncbi:MAG: hypothetical protein AAF557_03745 [Pseudomonadota bacterium]
MKHVLIVSDCDPVNPELDRQIRLAQIIRLYGMAAAKLDIAFLCRRSFSLSADHRLHRVFDDFDQIGMLPHTARHDHLDQDNPHLFDLIARLRRDQKPYDVIHSDRVLVRPNDYLADTWILDTYDAAWEGPWDGRKFDALLATFDWLQAHNAEFAIKSLRLPMGLSNRSRTNGAMIGWVGHFGNGLADRWSELLDILARRGVRLAEGVLLAGPDAHWVHVPPVLSPFVVKSDDPAPGAGRALALAVLPGHEAKEWLAPLTWSVAAGCPVLTTSTIAGNFASLWHLPTSSDAEGFADLICAWCDDQNRDDLKDAARTSAAAFRDDSAATDAFLRAAMPVFAGRSDPVTD